MDVVRKAPGALLNLLELLSNWLEGLLNLRGVDRKFFRKAHRSSVKLAAQQPNQTHACKHNGRRGHTPRQMQFLQKDYHGVKQDCEKCSQDDRDANRACVVAEYRQQTRNQYEE